MEHPLVGFVSRRRAVQEHEALPADQSLSGHDRDLSQGSALAESKSNAKDLSTGLQDLSQDLDAAGGVSKPQPHTESANH